MENVTVFDVMYDISKDVPNSWEARLLAEGRLSKDLAHGPDYAIDAHDAENDSVQFRVTIFEKDAEPFFSSAKGSRIVEK